LRKVHFKVTFHRACLFLGFFLDIDLGVSIIVFFPRRFEPINSVNLRFCTNNDCEKMRWTINLEGGPKRVNHASCVIGDKIYSFGGYCSGEVRSRLACIDVYALDTGTFSFNIFFN
jgi:hypothetical protein